jgi:putative ABC transport system permease protein
VVVIKGNSGLYKNLDAFADELRKIKGIRDVSQTWRSPFETVIGNGFSIKEKPTRDDDWHIVGGIAGDQHYLSTLDISLLAGRDFDPVKIKGDSTINEFIVNEAFLQHYQMKPEEVLGKKVILGLVGTGPIVGVVKDFHIGSLHSKIEPIVIFNHPNYYGSVLVKIGPGKMDPVLDRVGQVWKSFVPMRPLNYSFLDEEYGAMYRTEQRLGTLMSVFCSLAILITCLGLLGLAAFTIAQRTKEIGIRKVLGASVSNITAMLSKDFVILVLIALIIAFPLSWWAMNKWLQDFAYRIHISWWLFAGAGILALFIAMLTISYQSIKAALANPVKSLRTE